MKEIISTFYILYPIIVSDEVRQTWRDGGSHSLCEGAILGFAWGEK